MAIERQRGREPLCRDPDWGLGQREKANDRDALFFVSFFARSKKETRASRQMQKKNCGRKMREIFSPNASYWKNRTDISQITRSIRGRAKNNKGHK